MLESGSADFDAWHTRLEGAKTEREQHETIWKKLLDHAAGRNFRKGTMGGDPRPVNLVSNFMRVVEPHLLPRNHKLEVTVSPKREGDQYIKGAEELGDRITAVIQQIKLLEQGRRAARASLYSAGILKVGYEERTGIVVEVPSSKAPQQTVTVDVDAERVEHKERLDPDLPYCTQIAATRFSVDVGAEHLDEARWVAHELFPRVESIKADPRYEPWHDTIKASHQHLPRSLDKQSSHAGGSTDQTKVDPRWGFSQVFELYDRDARKVLLIPGKSCGTQEIIEQPWPEGIEGFPFVLFCYEKIEGYFWPQPPLVPTYDLMQALDTATQTVMESAARAKKLIVFDPGAIKESDIRVIETAPADSVIPVPGWSKHAEQIELGGVVGAQLDVIRMTKQMADEMNGTGEIQRGAAAGGAKPTATEVNAMMGKGAVRIEDMKGALQEPLNEVCAMIGALLMSHADLMQEVSLPVGDPKEQRFVSLGPGVVGEFLDYSYEMGVGPIEIVDPAIKQKRLETMIGMATDPNLDAKLATEGKQMRVGELIIGHLRSIGERNPDRILVDIQQGPGGDPAAEAQAEDSQMAQTNEAVEPLPEQDHEAHLAVHMEEYEAYGKLPAIKQHIEMHEMLMMQAEGGQPAQAGPPAPPQPGGAPGAGVGGGQAEGAAIRRQARA